MEYNKYNKKAQIISACGTMNVCTPHLQFWMQSEFTPDTTQGVWTLLVWEAQVQTTASLPGRKPTSMVHRPGDRALEPTEKI